MTLGDFKGKIPELKPGQIGLNLGCGKHKFEGWHNADLADADLNFDFEKFPWPIKDNTYDYIYSNDVLDHLEDFFSVMKEIYRIAKPGATVDITTPFYNCQTSWLPPHKQHMSLGHYLLYDPGWRGVHTPENKEDFGKVTLAIKDVRTNGAWFIPDLKIGRITVRYLIGMYIGEIVQNFTVKLEVIK